MLCISLIRVLRNNSYLRNREYILMYRLFASFLVILISCQPSYNDDVWIDPKMGDKLVDEVTKIAPRPIEPMPGYLIGADTILDYASPDTLDLTVHQLYIDTVRTYGFEGDVSLTEKQVQLLYAELKNWENHYTRRKFSFHDVDIGKFPRMWKTIRKLEGKYYLYDRCNGSDPYFLIHRNVVLFREALEWDVIPITGIVLSKNDEEITLTLQRAGSKLSDEEGPSTLSFTKTTFPGIYLMAHQRYEGRTWHRYVVPVDYSINKYHYIVNDCNGDMRREYAKFETYPWKED